MAIYFLIKVPVLYSYIYHHSLQDQSCIYTWWPYCACIWHCYRKSYTYPRRSSPNPLVYRLPSILQSYSC